MDQAYRFATLIPSFCCFLSFCAQGAEGGCDKPRACDAVRNCETQVDTRDCEPHWSCEGIFKFACEINKGVAKSSCEAAKGAQNAGYAAARASCEAQKTAEKADCERIKTTNRFGCEAAPVLQAVGDGISHFGNEVSKEFCNIMTLGAYKRGEASCNVDAGVGYGSKGFYTYSPSDPSQHYSPGDNPPQKTPSNEELKRLADALNQAPPHFYEYDFSAAFGVQRFLPGDYTLGIAWPAAAGPIATPTRLGVIRGADKEGGGSFLSLRADKTKGTLGFHAGEDYVAEPNERIYAPVTGDVLRMKNPGKRGLTGLQINTPNGYTSSIYYVAVSSDIQRALLERDAGKPLTNPTALHVEAGKSTIGYAQDLTLPFRYGPNITNHVHVTLQDPQGRYVAPSDPKTVIRPSPNGQIRVRPPPK